MTDWLTEARKAPDYEANLRAALAASNPAELARIDAQAASDLRCTELLRTIEALTGSNVINNSLGCRMDQTEFVITTAAGTIYGQAWVDELHPRERALERLLDAAQAAALNERALASVTAKVLGDILGSAFPALQAAE